jgi:hypothetical protein
LGGPDFGFWGESKLVEKFVDFGFSNVKFLLAKRCFLGLLSHWLKPGNYLGPPLCIGKCPLGYGIGQNLPTKWNLNSLSGLGSR